MSYNTTKSLLHHGSLVIPQNIISVRNAEGKHTGRTGVLQPVLCMPLYLLGAAPDLIWGKVGFLYRNWRTTFVATFNQWVGALALALFFLILLRVTGQGIPSFVATVVLAFATPWWTYSRDLFRQPIAGLLFLWAIHGAIRFTEDGRARHVGQLGLALALSFTNRITAVAAWPGIVLYAVLGKKSPGRFRTLVWVVTGSVVLATIGIAAQIGLNYWRFGHWWGWAYEDRQFSLSYLKVSVPDFLLSPQRGLLLFSPPLLLFGHAVWALWKKNRALCHCLLLALSGKLLLFCTYYDFAGGMNPGPRYLIPIIPIFYLFVGVLVCTEWHNRTFRWSLYVLAAVGAVVNGFNTLIFYPKTLPFWDQIFRLMKPENYEGMLPWRGLWDVYDVLAAKWILEKYYEWAFIYISGLVLISLFALKALIPVLTNGYPTLRQGQAEAIRSS